MLPKSAAVQWRSANVSISFKLHVIYQKLKVLLEQWKGRILYLVCRQFCLYRSNAMKRNIFTRIIKDESGATAIEYGLIVALVSMAAIGGYTALGDALDTFFDTVGTNLTGVEIPAAQ